MVKWSKTLQDRVKTTTVDIPYLGASALCPIAALKRMLATHPAHPDSPLFQIPQVDLLSPLTDSAARKHLKQVSSLLGLHRSLTFHGFCRGGGGHLGLSAWSSHSGHPGPGYLVVQLCMAIYYPSRYPVTSFSCIQIIFVLLASSPYLYWVFGPFFALSYYISVIILHVLYYIMISSPGGTAPLLNSRFMITLGDLDFDLKSHLCVIDQGIVFTP